jgi:hypothetical protein
MKEYGRVDIWSHIFLTLALVGGEWSASYPCRFTPGERTPGTHWIGGWMGPRDGLDNVENRKFLTFLGLELRLFGRPDRSQSLYRLSYPGSISECSISKFLVVREDHCQCTECPDERYSKQKIYISETNCNTRIRFTSSERNPLKFFFHARLTRMRQLVTFGELSNNVDTTGTSSMRVVASRGEISYGCPASF